MAWGSRLAVSAALGIAFAAGSCAPASQTSRTVCDVAAAGRAELDGEFVIKGQLLAVTDLLFFFPEDDCQWRETIQIAAAGGETPDGRPLFMYLSDRWLDSTDESYGAAEGEFLARLAPERWPSDIKRIEIEAVLSIRSAELSRDKVAKAVDDDSPR
jgi:hypothetical protein